MPIEHFGDEKHLIAAEKNANFLLKNAIQSDGSINRNYKDGKSSIHGFLDDYAFVISAFTDLYQATFDEKWLTKAKEITAYAIQHFYDPTSGMFYYSHDAHSDLIARKMEVSDNVIPASNSEMAKNLFTLGHYFGNNIYVEKSRQMLANVTENVHANIRYYSNWALLEAQFVHPPFEVAIVGKDFQSMRESFDQNYLPDVFLLGGKTVGSLELLEGKLSKGKTTIYVCQNKACQLPVTEVEDALKQIK